MSDDVCIRDKNCNSFWRDSKKDVRPYLGERTMSMQICPLWVQKSIMLVLVNGTDLDGVISDLQIPNALPLRWKDSV